MGNNDNRYSKKSITIIAIILIIASLFVIFFYPSDSQDPAAPDATDPVITVTKVPE